MVTPRRSMGVIALTLLLTSLLHPDEFSGMWSGGAGRIDGDRPFWNIMTAYFDVKGHELTGTLHSSLPGLDREGQPSRERSTGI